MNDQTKIKISYALRNRRKSANHAHRIAESLRGKKKSTAHKKAISAAMRRLWLERKKDAICRGVKTYEITPIITK